MVYHCDGSNAARADTVDLFHREFKVSSCILIRRHFEFDGKPVDQFSEPLTWHAYPADSDHIFASRLQVKLGVEGCRTEKPAGRDVKFFENQVTASSGI